METLRFLMVSTFYPPYHLGGDAVHVQYLAEALAERGHEVHVEFSPAAALLKGVGSPDSDLDGDVQLHPIPSPLGGMQPLGAYLRGQSRSVTRFHNRLVEDITPDVIHHHNISLLGRGVVSGGRAERILYTAHDYWLRCPRSDLYKYGRYPCDAPTCGRCALLSRRLPQPWRFSRGWKGLEGLDWTIAPSAFMRTAIEREVACPVVTIPNFAPDPNAPGSLFPPDQYYLYVGVYERHKGLPELLSVTEEFEEDIRFILVGRGSLERQVKRLANQSDNVDAVGWLRSSRLGPLYRGARGLILPSRSHENSPLAAVEALSWGTPLLVSKRGGLEELVEGGAGIAFEPTPREIRRGLERFEAEGMPDQSRLQARSAYETRHHPVRYLERYMILIEEEREEAMEKVKEGTQTAGSLDSTSD